MITTGTIGLYSIVQLSLIGMSHVSREQDLSNVHQETRLRYH